MTGSIRKFFLANLVDTLGSGMYLPYAVLFIKDHVGLNMGDLGLALSGGVVLAFAAIPLSALVTRRYGPKLVSVISMVLRAIAFLAFLWVHGLNPVIVLSGIVGLGDRTWSVASKVLIKDLVPTDNRSLWLGRNRIIRNLGFLFGGVLGAVLAPASAKTNYGLVVIVNAASFLAASSILITINSAAKPTQSTTQNGGGVPVVLTNSVAVRFLVSLLSVGFLYVVLNMVVPLYAVKISGGMTWLPGFLFGLNSMAVVIFQEPLLRGTQKLGDAGRVALGSIVLGSSYVAFLTAGQSDRLLSTGVLIIAMLLFSVGEQLFFAPSTAILLHLAHSGQEGAYMAAYQGIFAFDNMIGPVLVSFLVRSSFSYGGLWIALAALAFLGAALQRFTASKANHALTD